MKGPNTDRIRSLFDSISGDYDKLNHILSLGVDKSWRKRALKYVSGPSVLDVACGTGDFAVAIAGRLPDAHITGVDLSEGMLAVMEEKVVSLGLSGSISAETGNCESLRFPDDSFNTVTIGFGIRNFEHREEALKEILRVLRPGGKLVILELSVPSNKILCSLYKLYFLKILPWIGGIVSGDKAAYNYLPASVLAFPKPAEWVATMESCGFKNVLHISYTLGICRLYTGEKQ
ncbi:MAG: bifunctional demethylmenaquinone methyltransferase/2-methoxy-6-polyprenyl-1,4-benzoquinol methylase UbiE [Bacteroidales bacterium]|nr:bifunctional demethylmenaquinone methyltransferase/2-methoxy-6-polyprenyl-1,4-benzoquinol methylase UbiE [Bacteroidales bacterium]